jgi:hypothetical protein
VATRKTISTILLSALVLGVLSPTGMCALMCERHSRGDARDRCGQNSNPKSGMAHKHSAMHHHALGDIALVDVTVVVGAQSCQTDCALAERFNVSRSVVARLTILQRNTVVPVAIPEFMSPDLEVAWNLDSGPPPVPVAYTASYSILRI